MSPCVFFLFSKLQFPSSARHPHLPTCSICFPMDFILLHSPLLYPIQLVLPSPFILSPDSCPTWLSLSIAHHLFFSLVFHYTLFVQSQRLSFFFSLVLISLANHSLLALLSLCFLGIMTLHSCFELRFSPVLHLTSVLPFPSACSAPSHPWGRWDGPCPCCCLTDTSPRTVKRSFSP